MQIVIDTNILVNAFRKGGNSHSKASKLINDVYKGLYLVYVSEDIVKEYQDVLSRKSLHIGFIPKFRWFLWIKRHAIFVEPKPTTQEEVEMGDEDDRKFFDVARCAKARLITRNLRHFPVDELRTSIDELY